MWESLSCVWKAKKISSAFFFFFVRKMIETWLRLYTKKSKSIFGIITLFMCIVWSQLCDFSFGGRHLTHDFWMLGEWCCYIGDTTGVSKSVEWFLTQNAWAPESKLMFLFGKMYRTDPALKIHGNMLLFCFCWAAETLSRPHANP